jgi:hypothetical protein
MRLLLLLLVLCGCAIAIEPQAQSVEPYRVYVAMPDSTFAVCEYPMGFALRQESRWLLADCRIRNGA